VTGLVLGRPFLVFVFVARLGLALQRRDFAHNIIPANFSVSVSQKQPQSKPAMRFSVLTTLLLASASASTASTAIDESQPSNKQLRRRQLLNEQQVSLKVNLTAKKPSWVTAQFLYLTNPHACITSANLTEALALASHSQHARHGPPSICRGRLYL
jgi:hypothetical protein